MASIKEIADAVRAMSTRADDLGRRADAGTKQIVIARTEMTGLEATGRTVTRDLNYFPEMKVAPEAKAAMWLRKGTDKDVGAAKAFAAKEGYTVFTYDPKEKDPLGKARKSVLGR